MTNQPFFNQHTNSQLQFEPTDVARGPWSRQSLHGHVLGGLMAHAIEHEHGDDEFQPARLTVDMFRLAEHGPVTVTTSVARQGGRIRVIDASLEVGGVLQARSSAVMLRRGPQPEGNVWSPPPWDVPTPHHLEQDGPPQHTVWETRPISGEGATADRGRVWMREVRELVAGQPLTPFVRAAMAADFTNPLGNSGDRGLEFVNADYTLYLHRLPIDEWIGVEVASHHSADGIATAACSLYDEHGPIGHSAVAGIANRRE
jgi:acyl-Coa thioesterase superfamily protein/acyl-CoA thioesterase superfamily protein